MNFWLFILHAGATWFMTGVIWFVQIVHYPLFAKVRADDFSDYERSHERLTTWVVLPVMVIEAGTAMLVVLRRPETVEPWVTWAGLVLLAAVWLSTFLMQWPQHEKLTRGFDGAVHAALVSSNWIRTAAWSARSFLVALMLYQLMQ